MRHAIQLVFIFNLWTDRLTKKVVRPVRNHSSLLSNALWSEPIIVIMFSEWDSAPKQW